MSENSEQSDDLILKLLDDRIVFFGMVVDDESVTEFKSKFMYLSKNSSDPITVYFNSPGGVVNCGFNMAKLIAESKVPVLTVNVGMVCGMAVFPFVAGIKGGRRCLARSTVILNPIQRQINGLPTSINYEGEKYLISFLRRHTKISEDLYDQLTEYEVNLDSLSQVRFGLSDGIAAKSSKNGRIDENFSLKIDVSRQKNNFKNRRSLSNQRNKGFKTILLKIRKMFGLDCGGL